MPPNDPHLFQLFWGLRNTVGLDLRLDDYELFVDAWNAGFQPSDYSELKSLCRRLWAKKLDEQERFDQYFELYFSQYVVIEEPEGGGESQQTDQKPRTIEQGTTEAQERSPQSDDSDSSSPSPSSSSPPFPPSTVEPDFSMDEFQVGQAVPRQAMESERFSVGPFTLNDEYFRPLTRRQLQQGWRGLRYLTKQGDSDQLDIPATVNQMSQQGMLLEPCYLPNEVNCTEILLLVDRSNSMAPFDLLSERLISTAQQSLVRKDFRVFYHCSFRNYPVDKLYSDPDLRHPVSVWSVLKQLNPSYTTALIFSDAGAARGGFNPDRWDKTQEFLALLRDRVRQLAWLNPLSQQYWQAGTAKLIAQEVPMVEFDLTGWRSLLKDIRGQRQSIGIVQEVDESAKPAAPNKFLKKLDRDLSKLVKSSSEPSRYDEAKQQILGFMRQFPIALAPEAFDLMCHAAFPLALTPDLFYYLRENFQQETPWQTVPDLLLSSLCYPVGYHLYELDSAIRHLLLKRLVNDLNFGDVRLHELSDSVLFYVQHRLDDTLYQADDFGEKPEWIALAYTAPSELAHEIGQRLKQSYAESESSRIQLASLAATLSEPLKEAKFEPLLALVRGQGRLARGDSQGAKVMFDQIPDDWVQVGEDMRLSIPGRSRIFGIELEAISCKVPWIALEDDTSETGLPEETISVTVKTVSLVGAEPSSIETELETVVKTLNVVTFSAQDTKQSQPFSFRLVKVERESNRGIARVFQGGGERWQINPRSYENYGYTERLSQDVVIELAQIPSGSFMMGSPKGEQKRDSDEGPQHEVTFESGFWMGRYPVTQAQWRVVAGFPQVNKVLEPDPSSFKGADRPVENVSWHDAMEFCRRLSQYTGQTYRLPSEAEWEYACRAKTTTPFHFGEMIMTEVANYDGSFTYAGGPKGKYRKETTPVTEFDLGNVFGLSDMHGNVWEWCLDHWHSNYEGAPEDGSAWIDEEDRDNKSRVLRGGSWNYVPWYCRSASRGRNSPDSRSDLIGFRVILAPR